MQIMIGCERLQAMKCFLILYFPPFSQNFFSWLVYIQLIVIAAIKHVFWVASSLPSNITLTTGNWFLWKEHFKNGILVFSQAHRGKRMSNDAAVTRQLNVLFVFSTEEGGGGQIGKKTQNKDVLLWPTYYWGISQTSWEKRTVWDVMTDITLT